MGTTGGTYSARIFRPVMFLNLTLIQLASSFVIVHDNLSTECLAFHM